MNVKDVIIEGDKEVFNDEVKNAIKEEVGKALAEVKKSYEINREREKSRGVKRNVLLFLMPLFCWKERRACLDLSLEKMMNGQ